MSSPSSFSSSSSSSSTASTSSSMSSIHPASLVDATLHSQDLLDFVDIKVSGPLIDYLVDAVADTVDFAMGRPSASVSRGRKTRRRSDLTKFTTFATTVLTRAEVTAPVILASLVYIDRARPHLHIALEEWALERVFLGALIVASKYLNDSTLKNVHWALCTGVFGKRDVGRIEREFLDVLDFELGMTEAALMTHRQAVLAAIAPRSAPPTPAPFRPAMSTSTSTRSIPADMDVDSPHKSRRSSHAQRHPRHHRRAPVPELSPGSSDYSSGSESPQTPSTADSSPAHTPERKRQQQQHGSFHDILKSFPIPLPGMGTRAYPIHVDA